MSEEKDESTMAEEQAMVDAGHRRRRGGDRRCAPQLTTTPGMPERQAVGRRQARVRQILHTLPPAAQEAILDDLEGTTRLPPASSSARTSSATLVTWERMTGTEHKADLLPHLRSRCAA